MKRVLALLLALCLFSCLVACENETTTSSESETESSVSTPNSSEAASTSSKPTEASKPTTNTPSAAPSAPAKPTLPFDIEEGLFNGGNALALTDKGLSGLTANRILNCSSWEIFHAYIYENMQTIEKKEWKYEIAPNYYSVLSQYAVPESVVYQYAAKFFNIDTATKNLLKASDRYDSSKGTYWVCPPDLWFQGYDAIIKGYESLGSDEYVLYVQAVETNHLGSPHSECATTEACIVSQPCFKTKIKATGTNSFVITSFDYIDKIPSNITKI